jgi:hypothetical protein
LFTGKPVSHPWLTETAENSFLEKKTGSLSIQTISADKIMGITYNLLEEM